MKNSLIRQISFIGALVPLLVCTGCTTGKGPDEITKEILWRKIDEPEISDKTAKECHSTKETHYTLLGIGWVKSEHTIIGSSDLKEEKHRTILGYRPPLWGFFGIVPSDDYEASTTTLQQQFTTMSRNRYRFSPGLTIGKIDLLSIRCVELDGNSWFSSGYTKATATRMVSKKTWTDGEGKEHPACTVLMTGYPD